MKNNPIGDLLLSVGVLIIIFSFILIFGNWGNIQQAFHTLELSQVMGALTWNLAWIVVGFLFIGLGTLINIQDQTKQKMDFILGKLKDQKEQSNWSG